MRLSDQILAANEHVLGQMLEHRFVADIRGNRLPADVFHRYLAYEGAFVDTAIAIFSYATARAPNIALRRWLIGVQDALANTQVPYFEQAFARLDIKSPNKLPLDVEAFDSGMLQLAQRSSFIEIITAMFAAEWMYWTWCSTAAQCPIADPDLKAWVDLHADPDFAAQACWLKETIDVHGNATDAEHLSAIFDRVMQLEIAFHTAAYEPEIIQGPIA